MRIAVLGSGSGGNALIVESGERRLMVDAGFSRRRIERQLRELGVDPTTIDALLVTHEHHDHARGADGLLRRYGIPLHATAGTVEDLALGPEVAAKVAVVRCGEPFEVPGRAGHGTGRAGFRVEAFPVPHDAREPVGWVIEDSAGRRLGLVADLGRRSRRAWSRLRDLDCLVIETNHDLEMLRTGPYPWRLKQRVAGPYGHLANHEAAQGVAELVSDRLQWVVLFHLSRTNNRPALAARAVGESLAATGSRAELVVTQQDRATSWLEIRRGQLTLDFGAPQARGQVERNVPEVGL